MALCCRPASGATPSSTSSAYYDDSSRSSISSGYYSTRNISSAWSERHSAGRRGLRGGSPSPSGRSAVTASTAHKRLSTSSEEDSFPKSHHSLSGAGATSEHLSSRAVRSRVSHLSATDSAFISSSSGRSTGVLSTSASTAQRQFWMLVEPEACAMQVAKYALTFGLADPYSRPDRALAVGVFKKMNEMRRAVGIHELQWSFRLHCVAARSADAIANGTKQSREYAPMNMDLANHLLRQTFFKPGEGSVEIFRMAQRGDSIAKETAEFWKKAALCADYVCCGIGAAESPVGARWSLVAFLVDLEAPPKTATADGVVVGERGARSSKAPSALYRGSTFASSRTYHDDEETFTRSSGSSSARRSTGTTSTTSTFS